MKALARERSSEKRRALLHAISDRFFGSGRGAVDDEVALFDDVVTKVLDEVEPMARAELSQRLADLTSPPRKTLLQLAEDDITVAEPILARSTALDDSDLDAHRPQRSQEHLAAIASRSTLSERVTDVLVDRGDDQVVDDRRGQSGRPLLRARGSRTLADRAKTNEGLLHRLSARTDLPERDHRRGSCPDDQPGRSKPSSRRRAPASDGATLGRAGRGIARRAGRSAARRDQAGAARSTC